MSGPPAAAAAPPAAVHIALDLADQLRSRPVPAGHFDEALGDDGALRPHWRSFASLAGALGAEDLARRHARVARQIHDNGVTYNVYAAGDGPTRPWALDALPQIIPGAEWEPLAAGLRQRARLLNAVAADIYGEQRLIAEGLIPPALVFGHPGFLRPCHGVRPARGIFLHHVAFDLARGPDGRWWVAGSRAQAPSGAGYALENRLTVSRLFPDAFRGLRVHMLAQFFRGLQELLLEGAPGRGQTPRVALLTPGPYNETYFEHAYLARYLGFALVEGGDLAVRDDRVYLKTLTGLEPVHALLRRLDDDFCDPLELRPDSTLGVPGLVQAWRAGNVLVANAFGMSVLESPALLGFMPAVCARLLGEPLAVPSIDTWWCGEAAALDDVEPRLAEMVVKRAFPGAEMEPVLARHLDPAGRLEWRERVRADPERYVLQSYVPLSQAPVWHDGALERRALMLRVFLVADGRGDYRVMPGGLSRVAGRDRHTVSSQRGGSSKDTWVLSERPVEAFSLLPGRLTSRDVARGHRAVSSRAGENLFWLGRYAERSEAGARLLRAVLSRLPDEEAWPLGLQRPVVRTCHRQGLLRAARDEYAGAPQLLERDLLDGLVDRRHHRSLAFNLAETSRVAGTVRDRLSADNWRVVNHLLAMVERPHPKPAGLAEALELIDRIIVSLVAVGGLEMEHMTRDHGWRLLSIGRHIERLLSVTTAVGELADAGELEPPAALEWLLDLSDSAITYRARYMRAPEWLAVGHLLLLDRRNPRSAAFQLAALARQAHLLPGAALAPRARPLPGGDLAHLVGELAAASRACRAAATAAAGLLARPAPLRGFLAHAEDVAARLSDALTLRHFSHVVEPARTTSVR